MPLSRCRKVPIVRSACRAIRRVKPALMSRIRPEKSAAMAAIVRHPDILCTNGAFKVLALGIVPARVLADQLKPFPAGQAWGCACVGVLEHALRCSFRCNGPGWCIDLDDQFWACPYDPVMSWMGANQTAFYTASPRRLTVGGRSAAPAPRVLTATPPYPTIPFVSRNSSRPKSDHSRPLPDFL